MPCVSRQVARWQIRLTGKGRAVYAERCKYGSRGGFSQTYRRNAARQRVPTLLDLNDFTTLYYYNIAYNLFTLRQSSRRSWRINQKAPKVEVYFSYYEGTMQHRAIRLMASKLAVAGIIEGNFTDEGLAAMSDCADMTTALSRELTQGIKNEVEDLSAVFKKMAKLKTTTGDAEVVDTKNTNHTTNTSTAIIPVETITEDLYDPYQVKDLDMRLAENIENASLQKLQQFKITDFPVDFDPFAEDMAA